MKPLLTILIIAFFSCTNSGKLTDATFPHFKYSPEHGTILNAGEINPVNTYVPTVPTTVGSYTVMVTLSRKQIDAAENHTIKFALIYLGIILSILLAVVLFIRKKDEEIKMPQYETENY